MYRYGYLKNIIPTRYHGNSQGAILAVLVNFSTENYWKFAIF